MMDNWVNDWIDGLLIGGTGGAVGVEAIRIVIWERICPTLVY